MCRFQRNCLLCPISDLQQLHEPPRHTLRVNAVKDIVGLVPDAAQISSRQGEVIGAEVPRQHLHGEAVGLILHDAVDGAGQLVLFVQLMQLAEMARLLVAAQGVLNVMGNRSVYILVGGFAVGKG